mgnify:CR=1 FL=1
MRVLLINPKFRLPIDTRTTAHLGLAYLGAVSERRGDEVVIFHGVTLGGVSSSRGHKRHPTLQAGAVIGSGAQLLGDITIGEGARVGSNAVVLGDVAPGATVVGVPAREVRRATPVDELPLHRPELPPSCGNSPDPVGATMAELISDMEQLRQRLAALEAEREQRNRYSG